MQQRQRIAALTGAGARRFGEIGDGGIGLRERGLAQEQRRREALDRAIHNALGVLRF